LEPTEPEIKPRRTILMVHGRGWKPEREVLESLWIDALRAGINRDFEGPTAGVALDMANIRMVHYGDLSNAIRAERGKSYDESLDVADLTNALETLKALNSSKKFRRAGYESLHGRSSLREFLADIGSPILSTLRLTDKAIGRRIPEAAAYWENGNDFSSQIKGRLKEEIKAAIGEDSDILVISHCLGTMAAYDAFWELSRGQETESDSKIDTWITMGSPLGDEFVKRRLAGASESGDRRFPSNIVNWYNIAAEDDFTCHDETVANDFSQMLDHHLISRIRDFRIYNLAVRYGRSNPHNALGYLIHPRVSKLVGEWLLEDLS
jgi:hypothetical protein